MSLKNKIYPLVIVTSVLSIQASAQTTSIKKLKWVTPKDPGGLSGCFSICRSQVKKYVAAGEIQEQTGSGFGLKTYQKQCMQQCMCKAPKILRMRPQFKSVCKQLKIEPRSTVKSTTSRCKWWNPLTWLRCFF